MHKIIFSSFLGILLGALPLSAQAGENPSAKRLFYAVQNGMAPGSISVTSTNEMPPPSPDGHASTNLGLRYYIRLNNKDRSFSNVLASRIFKSHEQFQIGLDTAGPTYIYVLNEDNTGQKMVLFPQPGQSSFVNATGTVFLPSKGCFEFDGIPGIEKLTILMSQHEIKQLDNYYIGGAPDLVVDGSKPTMQLIASKGIAFSDDSAGGPGAEAATYVVKQQTTPSDLLQIKLKLIHQ